MIKLDYIDKPIKHKELKTSDIAVLNFKPGKEAALVAAIFGLKFEGPLVNHETTVIDSDETYLRLYIYKEYEPNLCVDEERCGGYYQEFYYYFEFEEIALKILEKEPLIEKVYKDYINEKFEVDNTDLYKTLGMEVVDD